MNAVTTDRPSTAKRNPESQIQCKSVKWFRATYPHLELLLFSIPNGGWRYKSIAAKMVEEGMLAGAADILFLFPSGRWNGLAIEFKAPGRKPKPEQWAFGGAIMGAGYLYRVVYSYVEFKQLITDYLNAK